MAVKTEHRDLHVTRRPFHEQAGLKDLSGISHIKEPDLVEMCTLFPMAMAQLIIELAGNVRLAETKCRVLQKKIETERGVAL